MIHPSQEIDYQKNLEQAARNWLSANPWCKETVREVAAKIQKNNQENFVSVPCTEFGYSGTIWCDRCGFEKQQHPSSALQKSSLVVNQQIKSKNTQFRPRPRTRRA